MPDQPQDPGDKLIPPCVVPQDFVGRNPRLIAWSPASKPNLLRVAAIRVNSEQKNLDPDLYLNLLGDRIQAMVDRCEDPQAAVNELVSQMWESSLVMDDGHVPADQAGARLVWGNPLVRERLSLLDVELPYNPKLKHDLKAEAELRDDLADPQNRLMDWASALAQPLP